MTGDSTRAGSVELARLRWRARRGLLENDLIIQRFFDAYEAQLTEADVRALTRLFEMDDTDLIDVLLGRADVAGRYDDPRIRLLVDRMKSL